MTDQQHHSGEHESLDPNRPFIEPPRDSKVGYGKPPVQTRFQPGQSGNPKGRPKGSKNKLSRKTGDKFFDLVRNQFEGDITIKENGQPMTISRFEALLKAIEAGALKGKVGCQRILLNMYLLMTEHDRERDEAFFEAMKNYKQARQAELDAAERKGIELEPSFPHPSHIHLNVLTHTVHIDGPINTLSKNGWKRKLSIAMF